MATAKVPTARQVRLAKARELAVHKVAGALGANGRPTKYLPEMDELAFKMCLLGATNAQLADFFRVTTTTIDEWIATRDGFSGALTRGREQADAEIGHSLYHRAKGYSHKEDDIRTVSNGGGMSEIVITPTIKHYPPDTQAASLWLRNRQPGRWKDKIDVDAKITHDVVGDLREFLSAGRPGRLTVGGGK